MAAYLDHAATTPLRPEAAGAMLPWLTERFGNPSGSHAIARAARAAIDESRDVAAAALGVEPGGVVFTGGGTEADNLAIAGVLARRPGVVVCSAIEHHAVLHAAEAAAAHAGRPGACECRVVPVHPDGTVDLDALTAALDPTVSVVSIMLANNEVGTIQPLARIARLVRRHAPNAVLHTDAVQAFPWLDVAVAAASADLISVSAHKFGGPQGTGVLAVRGDVALAPLIHGGGQERDRRSGTHNVAGIVGLAAAMQATVATRDATVARVGRLRDRLADRLLRHIPGATETGDRSHKIAGNCHLCFEGIESESLLVLLDDAGLCASAGSACASGAMEPSHVLVAMGIDRTRALGSLRLSLGHTTTERRRGPGPQGRARRRGPPPRLPGRRLMRVLVAMSGGVDSSVAAALLQRTGHHVVGATMKLWGGDSDSGCCSVADVDDARRVAQQLGIAHHVFNFTEDFDRHVVDPYVADHAAGLTPNPCVSCNRHLKFDRFLHRATQLGFDAIATGHHARVVAADGRWQLIRGADRAKDQSYVLYMLTQPALARTLLPVGDLTKAEVRALATELRLRTAAKPDSQDVCFITRTGGRQAFLGQRMALHPGRFVDAVTGQEMGKVAAVELVTVGQRRGIGDQQAGGERRYALKVDVAQATVTVGTNDDLMDDRLHLHTMSWVDEVAPAGAEVTVQMSAHGRPAAAVFAGGGEVRFERRQRRVAPGQSVVLYDGDAVIGGGIAA